jgi:hypothetical protein
MAKAKQAKTSVPKERKRRPRSADRLVPSSGGGVGLSGRQGVDARDIARAFGRFAHLCAMSPADKSRLGGSIIASSSVANKATNKVMSNTDEVTDIANAWSSAMNEVMSQKLPDMLSDYIIDMVAMLRDHFGDKYSAKELSQIAKFIKSNVGERLVSDADLANRLCSAREDLQRKMVAVLQAPECFEVFQKHMRSIDV